MNTFADMLHSEWNEEELFADFVMLNILPLDL